jgi:hypothetical protein
MSTPADEDVPHDPRVVERTVKRSRIAEAVAVLTVVAAMLGAVATMVSNMAHDYAAVKIAEAQARAKVCP